MNPVRSAFLPGVLAAIATAAHAGAGTVQPTMVPLSDNVTYAAPDRKSVV